MRAQPRIYTLDPHTRTRMRTCTHTSIWLCVCANGTGSALPPALLLRACPAPPPRRAVPACPPVVALTGSAANNSVLVPYPTGPYLPCPALPCPAMPCS
ncbi:uncharacterized protein K452DRAFT_286858 [Aplosporella prunicola CBS 121167]|uniref:Uncharacterized protein n=1 Tax=Aplosporella prunicola CBS 121167 TaxID=1176127 RepID=A0A6A6BGI8_9PEZI|nr:uncharacterized protein K452DRAFT_286858 [Aplosporella prunicola CBS 121167]KAF2142435.1 hypothetical protein K452DRAFT_286858 [Aplosporella prunicola CBS 121167]